MIARAVIPPELSRPEAEAIAHGRHGDPFKVLGPRDTAGGRVIRAVLPGAQGVEVLRRSDRAAIGRLGPQQPDGFFEGTVLDCAPYLLRIRWPCAEQVIFSNDSLAPRTERGQDS